MAKASSKFEHTSIEQVSNPFYSFILTLPILSNNYPLKYASLVVIILQPELHYIFGMHISILTSLIFQQVSPITEVLKITCKITFSEVFFLCAISPV